MKILLILILKHRELQCDYHIFDEIETEMEKTILSHNTISLSNIAKYTYQNIYYLFYNICFKLSFNDLIDNIW